MAGLEGPEYAGGACPAGGVAGVPEAGVAGVGGAVGVAVPGVGGACPTAGSAMAPDMSGTLSLAASCWSGQPPWTCSTPAGWGGPSGWVVAGIATKPGWASGSHPVVASIMASHAPPVRPATRGGALLVYCLTPGELAPAVATWPRPPSRLAAGHAARARLAAGPAAAPWPRAAMLAGLPVLGAAALLLLLQLGGAAAGRSSGRAGRCCGWAALPLLAGEPAEVPAVQAVAAQPRTTGKPVRCSCSGADLPLLGAGTPVRCCCSGAARPRGTGEPVRRCTGRLAGARS